MVLCELLELHGAFRVGQQQDPSIVAIGGLVNGYPHGSSGYVALLADKIWASELRVWDSK